MTTGETIWETIREATRETTRSTTRETGGHDRGPRVPGTREATGPGGDTQSCDRHVAWGTDLFARGVGAPRAPCAHSRAR